ncbi:MAG: cytochrome c maturation protein CcmE [Flavobacteriales bacterium]|jgi:cytochrome c-type biogenesis protein CcmE
MKKMHIVLIVLIAAVSAILVSTYTKAVDSVTFAEAALQSDKQVKVVGTFDKTQQVEYDAQADADLTRFYVIDADGKTCYVHLRDKQGKPMGLEMSENVTLEGKMGTDGVFYASHMLMKCPSKYNDQKHSLSAEN